MWTEEPGNEGSIAAVMAESSASMPGLQRSCSVPARLLRSCYTVVEHMLRLHQYSSVN